MPLHSKANQQQNIKKAYWMTEVCVVMSTLCDPMDCSLPDSSAHGISQAGILVWVAISFSRGSSWPRDQTCVSCIDRRILYQWATWKVPDCLYINLKSNKLGNPLVAWWIWLGAFNAVAQVQSLVRATKIPQVSWHSQKREKCHKLIT